MPERDAPVTEQPAKKDDAVRDEARDGARVFAPTENHERQYEARIQDDGDAEEGERKLSSGHGLRSDGGPRPRP